MKSTNNIPLVLIYNSDNKIINYKHIVNRKVSSHIEIVNEMPLNKKQVELFRTNPQKLIYFLQ